MSDIKEGDKFTYEHPRYPNSSIIGKVMIAQSVDGTHVEKKDTEGELVVRRYPIEYCTKVGGTWEEIFEEQARTDGANYHLLKEWLINNYSPPKIK